MVMDYFLLVEQAFWFWIQIINDKEKEKGITKTYIMSGTDFLNSYIIYSESP